MRFHIMPFHFFGGHLKNSRQAFESVPIGYTYHSNRTYPLTRVQTDGFFYNKKKEGTVGAVLNFPQETHQGCTYPIYHIESAMEAKWAAIYFGLEMAKRCDQEFVGIESDSLSIVRQIMLDDSGNQRYARYYHHKIKEIGNELQWCGVRYVPSELIQVHKMFE
jgi:ribonuclease HI